MKTTWRLFLTMALIFSIASTVNAQGVALDAGYTFNKRSLGYIGVSGSLSGHKYPYGGHTVSQILLGVGGYYGSFAGKTKFIPTFTGGFSVGGVALFDANIGVSKYFIHPTVGFNALNLVKLQFGYSFSTKELRGIKMQGLTVGIVVSLGTRGYYVDLSN